MASVFALVSLVYINSKNDRPYGSHVGGLPAYRVQDPKFVQPYWFSHRGSSTLSTLFHPPPSNQIKRCPVVWWKRSTFGNRLLDRQQRHPAVEETVILQGVVAWDWWFVGSEVVPHLPEGPLSAARDNHTIHSGFRKPSTYGFFWPYNAT